MGNKKSKIKSQRGDTSDNDIDSESALKSTLKFQSHEFLVFGYIRLEIEPLLSSDDPLIAMGTPHELIQLIISYYNVGIHSHVLFWCGTEERTSHSYNQIHILNIKNHKKYKLSVYNLDDRLMMVTNTHYFDRLNSYYCSVSGAKLPGWVHKLQYSKQNVSKYKKYHIIFRFGGDLKYQPNDPLHQNKCDMLIVDQTKLNAISHRATIESYYCSIPTTIAAHYSSFKDFSMIYNNNYIIFCGGVDSNQQPTQVIKRFDLQTGTWDDDQFIQRRMIEARRGVGVCIVTDPSNDTKSPDSGRLISIGGDYWSNGRRHSNVVEMYSFVDNRSTQLSPLQTYRYMPGACYLPFSQQIICVGGTGYKQQHSQEIEMYDMNKDIWGKLKLKLSDYYAIRPLVWSDEMNMNILYIAGGNLYNGKRAGLGGIECIDMRDPFGKTWHKFGYRELVGMLELRNSADVFNDWTCRTGQII